MLSRYCCTRARATPGQKRGAIGAALDILHRADIRGSKLRMHAAKALQA